MPLMINIDLVRLEAVTHTGSNAQFFLDYCIAKNLSLRGKGGRNILVHLIAE